MKSVKAVLGLRDSGLEGLWAWPLNREHHGPGWCSRDAKVKLLECVETVTADELVLGQYVAGAGQEGYLEDPGVPKDSKTPTFAMCVMHIDNERWRGVPFIIKAGKVLPASQAVVENGVTVPVCVRPMACPEVKAHQLVRHLQKIVQVSITMLALVVARLRPIYAAYFIASRLGAPCILHLASVHSACNSFDCQTWPTRLSPYGSSCYMIW